MVTGDAALVREVQHFFPGIETAAVKTATSRAFAKSLAWDEASRLIEDAAYRAVKKRRERKLYVVPSPVHLEIVLASVEQADRAALLPRTERSAERRLRYMADDYPEAVKAFNATRTEQLLESLGELEKARRVRNEWRRDLVERWIHKKLPFEDPVVAW